ncbi:P-loop containing nucleoside triphosphate hydrolase protein [Punctularia strigosozonata HHB-11173 SS5]|uniref:P-loop containing nucleoside triphosphate hydrolase protein n=1 Tax=Punctularia strigosozonata (strain HHB-11173) TaxID=741275 RepID=UPI0004418436|nr:P-loop containing nucleoside triphosphate hydrolase protein [Punctularia strigosozonata HHB-11173 SS5]EIN11698.1 P-loop containing nucleoside triphosphate hydrolase protein [Punctularia strigosozonata HHB-11173 SS5]
MSSRPICHFYNKPGGCRRGASCKFAHVGPSAPSSPGAAGPSATSSRPSSGRGNIPPGVCSFFWAGNCTRTDCRFKHEVNPNTAGGPASAVGNSDGVAAPVVSFLTEAGLAKVMDSGTDVFFASSQATTPSHVHGALRRFLADDYRFGSVHQIYAFVTLLSSANSAASPSWTVEEGQLLLNKIATGNGLNRFSDIIQYPEVSMNAGSFKNKLSFQRGYVPALQYLSSEFVVKSTLSHLVNALYALVMSNFEHFADVVEGSMTHAMTRRSFRDLNVASSKELVGSMVLGALSEVLFECITRFKNAAATHPRLVPLIMHVQEWTETWIQGISTAPPVFEDPFKDMPAEGREHVLRHLKGRVDRIALIGERERTRLEKAARPRNALTFTRGAGGSSEGIIAALQANYQGPGQERAEGPRHDNDFSDIRDIRIAPTNEELVCRTEPYLPANFYNAPHHLPANSVERLLDIQFRLLREELTAPLRSSIQLVHDDLLSRGKTQVAELIKKGGGKYRGHSGDRDNVMFNVYTNVEVQSFSPDRRGISIGLSFDAPPGRARLPQAKARAAFWDSGKRLMQGGLIALIWKSGRNVAVHLGIVSSSLQDITESARRSADRILTSVVFFDPSVELRMLNGLKHPENDSQSTQLLIEAPVMFESIRPFLEALQRIEPASIPFARYLVHQPPESLRSVVVSPPSYASVPGFTFRLDSLFPESARVEDLRLSVAVLASVENARQLLQQSSRLDPSQADAVVTALTRELALIQGPPGTGKSYTGVELLRVLIKNGIRPILMIAFTNHALDHLLTAALDAGITTSIARLGSRSADERIAKYNIEEIEKISGRSRLDREFSRNYRELKDVEKEFVALMQQFLKGRIESSQITDHLQIFYPELYEGFHNPVPWIAHLYHLSNRHDGGGPWERQGKGRVEEVDDSMYAYWRQGLDLTFLSQPGSYLEPDAKVDVTQISGEVKRPNNHFAVLAEEHEAIGAQVADTTSDSDLDSEAGTAVDDSSPLDELWQRSVLPTAPRSEPDLVETVKSLSLESSAEPFIANLDVNDLNDPIAFFVYFGYDSVPSIPVSDRPLARLLDETDIWSFSMLERERLDAYWTGEIRTQLHETQLREYERLRERHTEMQKRYDEGKNEIRRQLLNGVDIIGATTTGAARLTALLSSIGPKVMLVEEAGQVLETHIIGSLTRAVQHCILIGDPLQLRPTLNNYALSMDNPRGRQLYKFDQSLMERLSSGGFPMSRIDVQRRMRPTISNLIRQALKTLYPTLEDHDLVKAYPHVRGLAKDVFFFTHNHKENGGGEESSSKFNTFEVDMIKDLVLYLLRQGSYSQEGDIVVLCGYLGQLARVRDALAGEVAVLIDERDQADLADHEAEADTNDPVVEQVKVAKRVRIRTIDNYQGEEAKIVILSLVRNSGIPEDDDEAIVSARPAKPNIGFLKSENRTNVALSRAKEGLFILGNAHNLAARSGMWREVIDELEKDGSVGDAFPVACHQHPDPIHYISTPGQLPQVAPDGGCLRACATRLKCGHLCPYKCHADDPGHIAVICNQQCTRLCPRGHPCRGLCADPCGDCHFPIKDVTLPCGHQKTSVPCYIMQNLEEVPCEVPVERALPSCEHVAVLPCYEDPSNFSCPSPCNTPMGCCNKTCPSPCSQCQAFNARPGDEESKVPRTNHKPHPCERSLFCGHRCQNPCSETHECTSFCKESCRQVCEHARCRKPCGAACAPCQEPCTWACPHYSCPVPCGSVCARLPCDRRCSTILLCGHRCPSVCGEDCQIQTCPICASPVQKEQVVDVILGRTLQEVEPDHETLDELLITLPCRHTFTVETLDGHCDLNSFYDREIGPDGSGGSWLRLAIPPSGFLHPKTCPTCRGPIVASRYGRAYKRADLDILERNVASNMSRDLRQAHERMNARSKSELESALTTEAANVPISNAVTTEERRKKHLKKRKAILKALGDSPCPTRALHPGNADLFPIPLADTRTWKTVTENLLAAYQKAVDVATTRSSHIHAWEAAFTSLYNLEKDRSLADPATAPRNIEEHAMRVATIGVGQPRPRADSRFRVEAYWATLQVRFLLADLARAWLETLTKKAVLPLPEHCRSWAEYIAFVLKTCTADAMKAQEIAQASQSRRQVTKTSLMIMRANLEEFRFAVFMTRQTGTFKERRDDLLENATRWLEDTREFAEATCANHREGRGTEQRAEEQWLTSEFIEAAEKIIGQWESLLQSIRGDAFYQPLSLDEMTNIVKALDFTHTGHYYQCPNGHTYVITECGGAMQAGRCPECGAAIGGGNHSLVADNTQAIEFERLARGRGAQDSPWAWGRVAV